jgi:hypothetical protein
MLVPHLRDQLCESNWDTTRKGHRGLAPSRFERVSSLRWIAAKQRHLTSPRIVGHPSRCPLRCLERRSTYRPCPRKCAAGVQALRLLEPPPLSGRFCPTIRRLQGYTQRKSGAVRLAQFDWRIRVQCRTKSGFLATFRGLICLFCTQKPVRFAHFKNAKSFVCHR